MFYSKIITTSNTGLVVNDLTKCCMHVIGASIRNSVGILVLEETSRTNVWSTGDV